MQYINLNKTLEMENKIVDLLLISIDDQIEITDDKEGIKIIGNIIINGKAKTDEGEKEFNDNISLDVFLMYEEVVERNLLNVSIDDFTYDINDNKLILNISLKIDGLKEIETNFLATEDSLLVPKEEIEKENEIEIEEEKKVYIDIDIDVNNRNEEANDKEAVLEEKKESLNECFEEKNIDSELGLINIEREINTSDEENEKIKLWEKEVVESNKKSLLKCVFSNRKIHEEVSWRLHCVKSESSYEEIARKYNLNLNKLISINNNEKLEEGKLIFLPLE